MEKRMLGLRTVIYKVSDLAKAKEWYTQAFGVEPYFDEPFYVGFNIGGYELGLQPADVPSSVGAENVVAYWGVHGLQAEYDRLLRLGARMHEAPQDVGGDIVVATLTDPWNNVIGLIFNPGFKAED